MNENYRLFFNIKSREIELEEEVHDEKKIFEGEKNEFELLEKEPLGETETDDEKKEVENMPSIDKTEKHIGAESELVTEILLETHSAPFTVPVTSTSHASIPRIAQHMFQIEARPDDEAESGLALFLQSLRQTGETKGGGKVEIKFGDEIQSVVGTYCSKVVIVV